jgi:3-ketosteroid 9alpha-monooxygenase subunit B
VSKTASPPPTRPSETDSLPARRKLRKLDVMVADIIQETPDTFTLVLFTGNERLEYKAGHFITIDPHQFDGIQRWARFLEDQKGKIEPPRAYSLSSAPHETHLAITVKEEEYITGFTGPYVLPEPVPPTVDGVVHICAGSGIVPSFSIIKEDLSRGDLEHTLVYSNKTFEDIIFCQQLDELQRQYPERLRLIHCLTRQETIIPGMPNFRKTRVTNEILEHALEPYSDPLVFICGPANSARDIKAARERGEEPTPRFYETVRAILANLGADARVIKETYG